MTSSPSAAWLSDLAAPLAAKFGNCLTLSRSGNAIRWGYGGQSAVLELGANGALQVTFLDAESTDLVSAGRAVAAYRTRSAYALDRPSSTRMIADLVDFFSGVREPKFAFVDAYLR
jgi:hypothetical protein